MSNTQTKSEEATDTLTTSLNEMTENLRCFSSSMRGLYAEKNVGTSTEAARKFTEIRDKTRDDAKVYLKVILPLTTKFVSSINDFFEFYEALSYDEWCEMLPIIVEEVKNQKDLVETLRHMHDGILVTLKEREDEAKIVMTEFKNLQSKFEEMTREFEGKASLRYKCAYILAFIPGVNIIACPLLKLSAQGHTAQALAKTAESETLGAAALLVSETLVPALSHFIEGLSKAAGFFQIMEEELESFKKRGEASCVKREEVHYKMMKCKAKKIQPSAHQFYASLPAVRTDFDALPDFGADQNYIEKWLEEKLKEISEKRISTRNALWDVVKGIKGFVIKPILRESLTSANNE